MTPLRLSSIVLLACLATSLFGCDGCGTTTLPPEEGPVGIDRPDAGGSDECVQDWDCPFGEECVDGACQPVEAVVGDTGCQANVDCGEGFSCALATGVCIEDAATPPPKPGPPGPCVDGEARSCGVKIGRCDYGVERCVDGNWSGLCEGGVGPRGERCDGEDDDCDGDVDNGFGDLEQPCVAGLGVCEQAGFRVCDVAGTGTQCSVQGLDPAGRVELCGNGSDDDCDGVDDDQVEFADLGDPCSVGVGGCARAGTLVCAGDGSGTVCDATPGNPGADELCGNGTDDDCDGDTDEGFETLGAACQQGSGCNIATGTLVCSADLQALACATNPIGPEALCNGLDDDSDTCIDDGFVLGAVCSAGVGACRRTGATVCDGAQTGVTCDAVPGAPGVETCGNAVDEDCVGGLDNGFNLGQPCTVGVGACQRSGTLICDTGSGGTRAICSATPGAPSPERCGNAVDEDCVLGLDNGFTLGAACQNGVGICQRDGVFICNTANTLAQTCNAVPGSPDPRGELCGNGLNDDCDGQTDEGFGQLGQACTEGAGECLRNGTFVCSADRTAEVCNAVPGTPVAEQCDDRDNDCNTVTDNGCDDDGDDFCDQGLVFAPSAGAVDVCPLSDNAADLDCNDADPDVNPDAAEVCLDARDQNCDGDNNDGCAACNPGVDADFDGSNQCLDCDDTNGAVRPGGTERCDGLDNNCNGQVDEPFDVDGDGFTICGTAPGGGLDLSRVDCNDAVDTVYPGACELCANAAGTVACGALNDRGNTVDENCNGFVDETCSPCSSADADRDGASQCDGDCADNDPAVRPGLPEVCDGKDTDCNRTTVENCAIGERCGTRTGGEYPPQTDSCQDNFICVFPVNNAGNPSGDPTCTSFCNASFTGAVGDGCAADEVCSVNLVPTTNLNGCQPFTDALGTLRGGATCTSDANCRSGDCYRLGPSEFCFDHCGNDAQCATGSTCQLGVISNGKALCFRTSGTQTRDTGTSCSGQASTCRNGSASCIDMTGVLRCTEPCCTNTDCPNGYYCSLNGPNVAVSGGGVNTTPVCFAETGGNGGRQAGAACTSNTQCASEFCDRTLSVCVDVCCSDDTCPIGLGCESSRVRRGTAESFGRFCLSVPNLACTSDAVCGAGGLCVSGECMNIVEKR